MSALTVDCFWSFRSPYSYLATPRMVRIAETFEKYLHHFAEEDGFFNDAAR